MVGNFYGYKIQILGLRWLMAHAVNLSIHMLFIARIHIIIQSSLFLSVTTCCECK